MLSSETEYINKTEHSDASIGVGIGRLKFYWSTQVYISLCYEL